LRTAHSKTGRGPVPIRVITIWLPARLDIALLATHAQHKQRHAQAVDVEALALSGLEQRVEQTVANAQDEYRARRRRTVAGRGGSVGSD
jgi:hypothetical protein